MTSFSVKISNLLEEKLIPSKYKGRNKYKYSTPFYTYYCKHAGSPFIYFNYFNKEWDLTYAPLHKVVTIQELK